jgi:hypothetical protein
VDFSLSGRNLREYYSVNVDPLEGNLRRLDLQDLEDLFPGSELRVMDSAVADQEESAADAGKGEIWQSLLILLLLLVGLELVLSWKFGNYS